MKILVLADSRSFHTGRYVSELRRQGCEVLLASLESEKENQITLKHRGLIRSLNYAASALEIRKLVKQFQPDIINPHFASGYGFAVALSGVRKSAPVVLQLWGSDILIVPKKSSLHRWKTAYALRRTDCVLGDSEYILNKAKDLAPLKRTGRIFWGIEEDFLTLRRGDFTNSVPLKVIVPRPHEAVYNNQFLLEALAPIVNDGKIEIVFPDFGGGVEAFRAEAEAKCGDRVRYYSKMSRRDFLTFLAGHDVYLSGAVSDSSPVSLMESLALGLIPVAADIPGVREWLNDESGFLFDINNADRLRQTMAGVIESIGSLGSMRRTNMARVQKEAVFEKNMAETIDIMRELADGRSQ